MELTPDQLEELTQTLVGCDKEVKDGLQDMGFNPTDDLERAATTQLDEHGVHLCCGCGYWVLYIMENHMCEECYHDDFEGAEVE